MSTQDEDNQADDQEQEEYVDLMYMYDDGQRDIEIQPPQGRTLLPGAVASVVSSITGLSSLTVRVGTKIGGWGLYAGREATLKSLSVSKTALETVLVAAGRDVSIRSNSELGKEEAATLLERSVTALHSSISTISFLASTGFYLTEASMNTLSGLSIQGLSTLNAILGSTESSRAVASIITLVRNELSKPDVTEKGEVVSFQDLLIGTIGFVLLQRWGRRQTERDFREAGGEETIWDTVIDDKGFRADVVGTRRKEIISLTPGIGAPLTPFPNPDEQDSFAARERAILLGTPHLDLSSEDQSRLTDDEIRDRILAQLPPGTRAVVTSETISAKTIKVEIYNMDDAQIEAPPGTVMVAERSHPEPEAGVEANTPRHTIIFRTALNRSSSAKVEPGKRLKLSLEADDEHDSLFMRRTGMERSSKFPDLIIDPEFGDELDSDYDAEEHPLTQRSTTILANQKKPRRPIISLNKSATTTKGPVKMTSFLSPNETPSSTTKPDKGGILKRAFKSLSSNSAALVERDVSGLLSPERTQTKTGSSDLLSRVATASPREFFAPNVYPPVTVTQAASPSASPTLQPVTTSYFTIRERRRDSIVSQTDTYSVRSIESRPGSPNFTRLQSRTTNGLTKNKSEHGLSVYDGDSRPGSSSSTVNRRRTRSYLPSLYSMATRDSKEAIVLAPKVVLPKKSIYDDSKMLAALAENGTVPGLFPNQHLVATIRRFSRFASASYGANFLRVMGISSDDPKLSGNSELRSVAINSEHNSFSEHTGLPSDTILLSSFFDPRGVTGNTEWSPSAISPLIHFICVDHDSKAVVLTCRGTLGFEDVLTDMTCDYDDINFRGQTFQVHKGIHASARRLLGGDVSRVMTTIQETLEQNPEYGLILVGHSLGGAVAATLAILISEPSKEDEFSFVTANRQKLLTQGPSIPQQSTYTPPINLPVGRRIHVYAYGPPATVSEPLRLATRGLITTIVNNADIVPSLSLGVLHDFRAMSLHLKHDTNDAIGNLKARVWRRVRSAISSAFYVDKDPPPIENIAGSGPGEDTWAWTALRTLRESMTNSKLVPPGEVFLVETTRVFDRLDPDVAREAMFGSHDHSEKMYRALGRPATRVQLKLMRDVETWYGELRFGRDMFGDHSPGRYESSLAILESGVIET